MGWVIVVCGDFLRLPQTSCMKVFQQGWDFGANDEFSSHGSPQGFVVMEGAAKPKSHAISLNAPYGTFIDLGQERGRPTFLRITDKQISQLSEWLSAKVYV